MTQNDSAMGIGARTSMLKYGGTTTMRLGKRYKDGEGPADLHKTYIYNHKLTQQVFDILEDHNDAG